MSVMRTYIPSEVKTTFRGVEITGYAEGTFIEVERDEDGFMKYVGSGGDVCRTQNLNRSGKVTITLMMSASSNDVLSASYDLDDRDGNAFGPFSMKDLNGTTRVHSAEAWISKLPKVERGKEHATVQWVLECADLEIVVGGNTSIIPA